MFSWEYCEILRTAFSKNTSDGCFCTYARFKKQRNSAFSKQIFGSERFLVPLTGVNACSAGALQYDNKEIFYS